MVSDKTEGPSYTMFEEKINMSHNLSYDKLQFFEILENIPKSMLLKFLLHLYL